MRRKDEAYMAWLNWNERYKTSREESDKLKAASRKKTDQWALYRECTRLLESKQDQMEGNAGRREAKKVGGRKETETGRWTSEEKESPEQTEAKERN